MFDCFFKHCKNGLGWLWVFSQKERKSGNKIRTKKAVFYQNEISQNYDKIISV